MQGSLLELFMERDDQRDVLFQVVQEEVAAALEIDDVARPAKGFDDLFPGERPAQTWTSISLMTALGLDLIWLTFSRPSR